MSHQVKAKITGGGIPPRSQTTRHEASQPSYIRATISKAAKARKHMGVRNDCPPPTTRLSRDPCRTKEMAVVHAFDFAGGRNTELVLLRSPFIWGTANTAFPLHLSQRRLLTVQDFPATFVLVSREPGGIQSWSGGFRQPHVVRGWGLFPSKYSIS